MNNKLNPQFISNTKTTTDKLSQEEECVFWCGVLYTIGSYMINASKINNTSSDTHQSTITHVPKKVVKPPSKNDNMMYDHVVTRLFCGYWILYTIAVNAETTKPKKNRTSDVNNVINIAMGNY